MCTSVRMYFCAYVSICTSARMCICLYVCAYVRLFVPLYVCMHICTYVRMWTYVYVCMCMYVCLSVCPSVCLYLWMYVSMSVCVYIYICTHNVNMSTLFLHHTGASTAPCSPNSTSPRFGANPTKALKGLIASVLKLCTRAVKVKAFQSR